MLTSSSSRAWESPVVVNHRFPVSIQHTFIITPNIRTVGPHGQLIHLRHGLQYISSYRSPNYNIMNKEHWAYGQSRLAYRVDGRTC